MAKGVRSSRFSLRRRLQGDQAREKKSTESFELTAKEAKLTKEE